MPWRTTLSLRRHVSSTRHMMYHHSDPFLSNFSAYLRSRPGGKRSETVIASLCKDVAKYLYFLDKERVRPELLLMKRPLVDYLKVVEEEYGIGYSSMLHKMEKKMTCTKMTCTCHQGWAPRVLLPCCVLWCSECFVFMCVIFVCF